MKIAATITLAITFLAFGASAGGQTLSRYGAHFEETDYSGFSLTEGGVITAPYRLVSGPDITGGEDIIVSFHISQLSDGRAWIMSSPSSSASNLFRFNTSWEEGQDTKITATIETEVPSIDGYVIDSENLYLSGLVVSDPNYPNLWRKTTPSMQSHLSTFLMEWDFRNIDPDDNRSFTDRFNFKNRYFDGSVDPRDSYITFAIPEPSTALLGGLGALVFLLRRRRFRS